MIKVSVTARSAAYLLQVWLCLPLLLLSAALPAQKVNDPTEINPIHRSWKYTQRGDYVLYRVLGAEHTRELWVAIGSEGNVHAYQVTKYKDDEQLGEKEIRRFTLDPETADRSLASAYERQGYFATREVRQSGDISIPALRLHHPSIGEYVYSEDVPLGGMVKRVDNATGLQLTLVKMERKQQPPPSRILIDRPEEPTGPGISISRRPNESKSPDVAEVRSLDVIVREDAEAVPPYFRRVGDRTKDLNDFPWILNCRVGIPASIAVYEVEQKDEEADETVYSGELRIQNEGKDKEGRYRVSLNYRNMTGDVPEDISSILAREHGIGRLIPQEQPLLPGLEFEVYRADTETLRIRGRDYRSTVYKVYEDPQIQTEATADGGEKQRVQRTLHTLWIAQHSLPAPVLLQRETGRYDYEQETDDAGRILWSRREETQYRETLTYLRTDVPETSLQEERAEIGDPSE